MSSSVRLALAGLLAVILLGAAAWWYLLGPNMVSAAELVPADTLAFAAIPNGVKIAGDYRESKLKVLAETPNAQPLLAALQNELGQRNVDLCHTLLPCLSGQSFIALTHFDPQQPAHLGLIAAMRPKFGFNKFNQVLEQIKSAYAPELKQATIGTGQVDGVDYQSVQIAGEEDKICVATVGGWTVTTWGEAPLDDFIQRLHKTASTPSLAQQAAYQTQLARVGKGAEGFLYLDVQAFVQLAEWWMPAKANQPDYLASKSKGAATVAIGTEFVGGEIADHFSILNQSPSPAPGGPCPFDTLKFTGTDTLFYWAANIDWAATWKQVQAHDPATNVVAATLLTFLQNWTQADAIDFDRNVIGALGSELSVQAEWSSDNAYPEIGLIVKVNKPDDFKPTITALIDTVRKVYATTAVVDEISVNSNNFATVKFIQALPVSPTITEDGPYFGIFLTENQAARALSRDGTIGLLNNGDFVRQTSDGRPTASQLAFLDTPRALSRAYGTLSPYLSLAAMFSPSLAAWTRNNPLPPDFDWLAPMGTWSFTLSPDAQGYQGTSMSGIGNQGIFLGGALNMANTFPMIADQWRRLSTTIMAPPAPPPVVTPPAPAIPNATVPAASAPSPPATPGVPAAPPPASVPPVPPPISSSTNAAPSAAPPDVPKPQ